MKKIILMTMLMGAVFAQRGWEGADLSGANLNRQNLEGLNLYRADLTGAILEDADLTGANLTNAILEGANLESARLEGATLEGAILEGVRSSRIRGKPASLPKGWSLVYGRLIKKDGE